MPSPTRCCSASRPARPWTTRRGCVLPTTSSTSRARRRWPTCSRPSRRRWPTPWRSPSAAIWNCDDCKTYHFPQLRAAAGKTLDEHARTRWPARGWKSAWPRSAGSVPDFTDADEQRYRDRLERRTRLHQADGLPRLLPDRRRLHQLGQGSRHPGRSGPRLGRRLAWSPTPSASPTSTRSPTTCCSSASSIRNASPCPISTSTSASTAASG